MESLCRRPRRGAEEPPETSRMCAGECLIEETIEDFRRREVLDNVQAKLFHVGMKRLGIQQTLQRLPESRGPAAHSVHLRLQLRRHVFGKRSNIIERNLRVGKRPYVAQR